jgi:xylose dehydrogenase (NAD/NADP)
VDAGFAGLLRCKDGVLGLFDCGFRHPFRTEAEVVGSEGHLILERPYLMDPSSRLLLRREVGEEVLAVSEADPYQCEVEALAAAVFGGADVPVSLAASRANVATLVALYESARQGRPVKMQ